MPSKRKKEDDQPLHIMRPDTLEVIEDGANKGQKDWFTKWEEKGQPPNSYFTYKKFEFGARPFDPRFPDTPFHIPHPHAAGPYKDLHLLIPGDATNTNRYVVSRSLHDILELKKHHEAAAAEAAEAAAAEAAEEEEEEEEEAHPFPSSGPGMFAAWMTEGDPGKPFSGGKRRKTRRHKTRRHKTRKTRKHKTRRHKTRRHKTRRTRRHKIR